jgi:hypothetical protein
METTSHAEEERRRIVLAWRGARAKGEDQKNFCAAHNLSPRTLRSWLTRYRLGSSSTNLGNKLIELVALLERLEVIIAGLSALNDNNPAPADVCPRPPFSAAAAAAEKKAISLCATPPEAATRQPEGRNESAETKSERAFNFWD